LLSKALLENNSESSRDGLPIKRTNLSRFFLILISITSYSISYLPKNTHLGLRSNESLAEIALNAAAPLVLKSLSLDDLNLYSLDLDQFDLNHFLDWTLSIHEQQYFLEDTVLYDDPKNMGQNIIKAVTCL
jgi:hypothetical protein